MVKGTGSSMSLTQTINNLATKASLLAAALLLLAGKPCGADTAPEAVPEYRLKAAYIYKILPFVHWPNESKDKGTLTVGVFGKDAHEAARQLLDGKTVKGKDKKSRRVKVVALSGQAMAKVEKIEDFKPLGECQVVFVSASSQAQSKKILKLVRDANVLTFGETGGFLEDGGIINFVAEKKKIRFEVNLEAARRARLKIDSQLLRLAKRVVKKR
jgi:YfiR/HmsC-like